ncbi:MAG: hypothetical protein JWO45_674 [Spartobacteria bacterium]|nr:hypothetical protein [Spartobacteria bacterium]
MTSTDNSQRVAAKVAGFAGLFAVVIVVFANYGLLNPLLVRGNAAETARNIIAHETQFRVVVACFLAYSLSVIVLLAALYVVLKPVNLGLALVGALFRFVFALMWLLSTLNLLGALRLLGSAAYLQVFEADRLQVLARLYIAQTFDDYYVGLPFFGLAATVCAWLWLKSNYIPRPLALFGVISSAFCVICAFVYLVFPSFAKPVNPYWFDSPMAIFEMTVSFWLLIKGLWAPVGSKRPTLNVQRPTSNAE